MTEMTDKWRTNEVTSELPELVKKIKSFKRADDVGAGTFYILV
jgi:hypothetical protein